MKNLIYFPLLLILTSCITHNGFTKLPSEDEYDKPKAYLEEKYKDISLYEEAYRGFSPNYPMRDDLVKHLGEPDKIVTHWSDPVIGIGVLSALSADPVVWVIYFSFFPVPTKTYVYKKGNHCIRANLQYSAAVGYEDYLTYWEWSEGKEDCL